MSSRRGAGEDNILAMLERDCARRAGPRLSGVRLAWYGAGAALCGILVGGVAWLAYDNQQAGGPLQVQVDAGAMTGRAVEATATLAAPPQAPSAGPLAAVIVDEQPRMRTAPPPLVMLPPHEVPDARAKAAPRTLEKQAPEAAVVLAVPDATPSPAARMTPRVPRAETARPLASAPDKRANKPAHAKPGAKPGGARPAARRPALAKAGGSADTSQAALSRARKPTAQPAPEPQLDGDVALISAIISQSERHRGEREDAAPCAGGKCGAKSARP